MNCRKCGNPIEEGSLFCGVCGAKVEAAPPVTQGAYNNAPNAQRAGYPPQKNPNQPYPQQRPYPQNAPYPPQAYPPQPRNASVNIDKKKAAKIGVIAGAAVLLIAVIAIVIAISANAKKKQPVKVDLNNYVSESVLAYESSDEEEYVDNDEPDVMYTNSDGGAGLIVNGYNNYANIYYDNLSNVIDWAKFDVEFAEELNKKKDYKGYTYMSLLNMDEFEFAVDKTENLKNGDTVTVTVNTKQEVYEIGEYLKIEIKPVSFKYTVSGLKDVNAFDPFKYVSVYTSGGNGDISVSWQVPEGLNEELDVKGFSVQDNDGYLALLKDGYIIANVDFYWSSESNTSGLKNGDIVTLQCSCDESEKLVSENNIYIVNYSKQYKIDKVGEYINKDFAMSAEDLEKFKSSAKAKIDDYANGSDYYDNIKFVEARIYDLKDKTNSSSSFKNAVVLLYSYQYTDWYDDKVTSYLYVEYENVVGADGKVEYSPDTYESSVNSLYDDETLDDEFSASEYNNSKIG